MKKQSKIVNAASMSLSNFVHCATIPKKDYYLWLSTQNAFNLHRFRDSKYNTIVCRVAICIFTVIIHAVVRHVEAEASEFF